MKFSICICTKNRSALLAGTLQNLFRNIQPFIKKYQIEILVVDNHSTDNTKETVLNFIRQYPTFFQYIFEPQSGLASARNAALKQTKNDIIIFFDDDMIVDESWMPAIIQALHNHPTAAVIGGQTISKITYSAYPWIQSLQLPIGNMWPLGINSMGTHEIRMTSAFLLPLPHIIRKKYLPVIGHYDTLFAKQYGIFRVFGGEDIDFIHRTISLGFPVYYVPTIRTEHIILPYKLTPSFIRKRYFENGKEICLFLYKNRRDIFWQKTKNYCSDAFYPLLWTFLAPFRKQHIEFRWITSWLFFLGYLEALLYILCRKRI